MSKSNIEWTEESWNPIVGCSIKSPGCAHCYAMPMAARIEASNAALVAQGKSPLATQYDGTTKIVNGHAVWTGKLALAAKTLLQPLKRKKPTVYFVNSMGDLFHEDCPDEDIDRVFAVMALSPHHTYQILTKRSQHMRDYITNEETPERIFQAAMKIAIETRLAIPDGVFEGEGEGEEGMAIGLLHWPPPNVWLGVSAERQQEWDERKEHLRATPAAVHFASFEPLLGPIIEPRPMSDFLQWAIAGGESGPESRPMHPDWPRALWAQCAASGVPFFFKQWGSCLPCSWDGEDERGRMAYIIDEEHCRVDYDVLGKAVRVVAHGREFARFGHKKTGKLLDGVEHQAMPAIHNGDHVLQPARSASR